MIENPIGMVLTILVINIIYVSFFTIRMILTMKGQKYTAAVVSMVEIVVYLVGLNLVLDNMDQVQNIIAYALGYGTGVIVGMKIEEKLALGYLTVRVISADPDLNFSQRLRELGYGVTSWYSYGMDGERLSMEILTPRKYQRNLYASIKEIDPKAFIISYEPIDISGGFWVRAVRKGKLFPK